MPRTEPFETYSREYDAWFDSHSRIYNTELDLLGSLLGTESGRKVEVGAGTGRFALPLGVETGIEPAAAMAERARSKGMRIIRGPGEQLPLRSGWFQDLLMVTTICFLNDINKAFREAHRVLRPQGSLVLGFLDRETEPGRTYIKRKESSRFYRYAEFAAAAEVEQILGRSGFSIAAVKQMLIPGQPPETVRPGYGTGGFVGVKAVKTDQ